MTQPSLPADLPPALTAALGQFESFLAGLPDTERAAVLHALDQIARRFRSVHPPPPACSTVDESPRDSAEQTGTVDEAHGKPIERLDKKTSRPVVPGYLILSELGRGGMGVVYKARHLALDRVVALKMILAGAHVEETQLQRFHTEAQAVARLQHPGIVQVFEIDQHDGLPYFSLEFVAGGTLASKIQRQPQPPREAAVLAEQIARAIQVAHEKGIIHRDLKPANVLLTEAGVPKVTDFGLARRLEGDAGQTRSGSILGTPNYMAPEQARGEVEKVGPLADVYSLGALLYELLTGRPPFLGATIYETLEQVESNEPVPPIQLAPHVPTDLDTICLKCLQKQPENRYQSAAELADDLRRFLDNRPIVARPVSRSERLWRLCRRNPVVSGLTVVLALLLVGAAVGGPIVAFQFRQERDRAVEATLAEAAAKEREAEEKEKAMTARDEERKAKEALEVLSDKALIAIRSGFLSVQDEFKMRPDLAPMRLRVTGYMSSHLDQLSAHLRSPMLGDRSAAMAHGRLGDTYLSLGQPVESKEHFLLAHAIAERFAKEHPESPVGKRNLAGVKNQLGEVALLLGNGRESKSYCEDALKLRQQWLTMLVEEVEGKRDPPLIEKRSRATPLNAHAAHVSIAQSYGLLGSISLRQGDPRSALEYYRQSKKSYDSVPARYYSTVEPLLTRRQHELERVANEQRIGKTSMQFGQLAEARKHLQEAFRLRLERRKREIEKKEPEHLDTIRDLALSRIDMGDLELLYDNNPIAAVGWYRLGAAGLETVGSKFPTIPPFARDRAFGDYRMGYACLRVAMLEKGLASAGWVGASQFHFDRARRSLEAVAKIDPKNTGVQIPLLLAEARCGLRTQALARVETLVKQSPTDARVLFFSACGYAVAGEREKALATIEKAVANGWKDIESLRIDPDLDSVRGDPRLVALERVLRDGTKK